MLSSQNRESTDDTITQTSLEMSQNSNDKIDQKQSESKSEIEAKSPETEVPETGILVSEMLQAGVSEAVAKGAKFETKLPETAIPEAGSLDHEILQAGAAETEVKGIGNYETVLLTNAGIESEVSESELLGTEESEFENEDMTDSLRNHDITESSLSMNSEDLHKAQFDNTLAQTQMTEDVEMTESPIPKNTQNMPDTPTSHILEPMMRNVNLLGARPKTSSPRGGPLFSSTSSIPKEERSEMVEKLDEMMKIMQEVKDVKADMNRLDRQIQNMEKSGNDSNCKLREGLQKTVEESIVKLGTSLRQNLNSDIDIRINERVIEEVQCAMQDTQVNLMANVDEKIERITSRKVTEDINEAAEAIELENKNYTDKEIQSFDKKVDKKIEEKVEGMVNERIMIVEKRMELKMKTIQSEVEKKMEKNVEDKVNKKLDKDITEKVDKVTSVKLQLAFEDYDEKLWRRKNLLVCNLEESSKKAIDDRKKDDLERVMPILNKVAKIEENDLESMPVRIGKVGNKPRMLRLALKSEAMVRHIHKRARENSNLINPEETDNKKKIYINRDYTEQDREMRKLARRQYNNERELDEANNQYVSNSKQRKIDNPNQRNLNQVGNQRDYQFPNQQNYGPQMPFQQNYGPQFQQILRPQMPQQPMYGPQILSLSLDHGRQPQREQYRGGNRSLDDDELRISTMEVGEMNMDSLLNDRNQNGSHQNMFDDLEKYGAVGGRDPQMEINRSPMCRENLGERANRNLQYDRPQFETQNFNQFSMPQQGYRSSTMPPMRNTMQNNRGWRGARRPHRGGPRY